MKKRMLSALALTCALLLLLSSASLAKSTLSGPNGELGAKARVGARVDDPPLPLYGDDDSPNEPKDDSGDGDGTDGKGTIAQAQSPSRWSLKDFWAHFRLQLSAVLRVWK